MAIDWKKELPRVKNSFIRQILANPKMQKLVDSWEKGHVASRKAPAATKETMGRAKRKASTIVPTEERYRKKRKSLVTGNYSPQSPNKVNLLGRSK